jgi:hypothetical protein
MAALRDVTAVTKKMIAVGKFDGPNEEGGHKARPENPIVGSG